jgi:hypothetical protein
MAKSKKQSISTRVRAYQAKHPTASAKQVAEACKTSAAYVYVVRSNDANWKTVSVATSNESMPFKEEAIRIFELTKGRQRIHPKTGKMLMQGMPMMEDKVTIEEPQVDNVNHPAHYKTGGIETIDFIQAKLTPEEFRGYLKGNVLKYVSRSNGKDSYETDMLKARWYLNREAERFVKAGNKEAA